MPKEILTDTDVDSIKNALGPKVMPENQKTAEGNDGTKKTEYPIINDRRFLSPADIGGDDVLTTKAPRQDIYSTKQIGGGYDKTSGIGINTGKRPVSFATLRRVAKESGLITAIISRREFQMRMIAKKFKYEGDIGFKVVHENHYEIGYSVSSDDLALASQIESMILRPWPMQKINEKIYPSLEPTFAGFCSKYIKDLLIINHPCIEIGRGRNGKPVSFAMIDGACIYPTHEGLKSIVNPLSGKMDMGQVERGTSKYKKMIESYADKYGVERLDEDTEWVFVNHGRPITGYKLNEMMVRTIFPSSEISLHGYPPSMTETALTMIIGELQAMTYELSYFEFGTMVDTIIGVMGAYGDKHIEEIVQHLKDNHTGASNAHKTPVFPMKTAEDIKTFPLKQGNNDMRFGELLTTLTGRVCAVYGMNPEEINVINRAGGGGTQFQGNRSAELSENKEEGLYACRGEIKDCLDDIIKEINPDFTFEWFGLNSEQDKIKKENIRQDLSSGKITIREARLAEGKESVPEGLKDSDVDVFLNPQWVQLHQAQQQAEMMKQQQQAMDKDDNKMDNKTDNNSDDNYNGNSIDSDSDDYEEPDFGEEKEEDEDEE